MPPAHCGAGLVQPLPGLAERARARGEAGAGQGDRPARVQRQAHQDPGLRLHHQHDDRDLPAHPERRPAAAAAAAAGQPRQQHDEDHAQEVADQRLGARPAPHGPLLPQVHRNAEHAAQAFGDDDQDAEYQVGKMGQREGRFQVFRGMNYF